MKRYTASIWENKYNQLINNGCCLVSIVAAVVLARCGESQQQEPPSVKASGANRKLAEWFKMPHIVKLDPNAKRLVAAATPKTTR
jgi:hypothetical protein